VIDPKPGGPDSVARVRIVHFADLVNRYDFIFNVAAHCNRSTFDLSVATLTARGTLNVDPGEIEVENFDCPSRLSYFRAITRLRRLLQREGAAILHSHHYEPSLLAALATAGLRTRLVVGRHHSDNVYRFTRGLRRRFYLGLERLCYARAAAVIAPSAAVERILLSQGVPRSRVFKIHYGLDLSRFERPGAAVLDAARREWPSGEGLRLATVGRLHPDKGQRFLLEALATLSGEGPPPRLVFVGEGSDYAPLLALAEERGLAPSVRFLGWRTDVLDIVAAADAVVQPTVTEAFSQVMLEAMAVGTPLVMTDVAGVRDVVQDGVSGLVVPIGDTSALAKAIRTLGDSGLRASLGGNAARTIRDRLDVRRIAREFEAVYWRVARGTRGPLDVG
jgi:glycosyltransferase involved in cell wall biosynthesis